MNIPPVPPALQNVPAPVLEEYIQSRLSSFMDTMITRLMHYEPELSSVSIQRAITDVLHLMTPVHPASQPQPLPIVPTAPKQTYQLVFRHDCMALGCLDPQCALCQHNPQRRCTINFDRKYHVNDVLRAKCGATIRVELVDRHTGALVSDDIQGLRLEVVILDGNAYEAKFVDSGKVVELGPEADEELDRCSLLLNKKKNTPLLVSGGLAHNDPSGRLMIQLQHGRAVLPDLSVTDSSEAVLLGRKPPFRLLVRANWQLLTGGNGRVSPPQIAVRHAVSEGFVVATRRTRTAGKVDIPSVEDPVGKLEHMGKETIKKLADISTAAQQAGVEIRIPENCVTKVGEFKQLALRADQDSQLRQRLQHVLKLSKEKWEEAREHAMRAVVADGRMRVWWPPSVHNNGSNTRDEPGAGEAGLVFSCRLGAVDMERPLALVRAKGPPSLPNGGMDTGGAPLLEAVSISQLTTTQRDVARKLIALASHAWWRQGHPGWAIQASDGGGGDTGMGVPAGLPQIAVHPACSSESAGHTPTAAASLEYVSVPPTRGNTPLAAQQQNMQMSNGQLPAPPPAMLVPGVTMVGAVGGHAPPAAVGHMTLPTPHMGEAGLIGGVGLGQTNTGGGGYARGASGTGLQGVAGARPMNPFGDVATGARTVFAAPAAGGGHSSPAHSGSSSQRTPSVASGAQQKRTASDMLMNYGLAQQQGATGDELVHATRARSTLSSTGQPASPPPHPTSPSTAAADPLPQGRTTSATGLSNTPHDPPPYIPSHISNPLAAGSPYMSGGNRQVQGMRSPPEQPNPFASLLAAHNVVSGDRGMSAPGGMAGSSGMMRSPPSRAAVTATPTFDLGALPSLPFQSLMNQLQSPTGPGQGPGGLTAGGGNEGTARDQAGTVGGAQIPPPGSAAAAASALRDLPSAGIGSFLASADLEAVLGQLGQPSLGDMETSLTGLGLGASLNLLPTFVTQFLDQQGASSSAWLQSQQQQQQQQQEVMDGLNTVTSGLDNMQSIEQALPGLDQETTQAYLARAQANSQTAPSKQHPANGPQIETGSAARVVVGYKQSA